MALIDTLGGSTDNANETIKDKQHRFLVTTTICATAVAVQGITLQPVKTSVVLRHSRDNHLVSVYLPVVAVQQKRTKDSPEPNRPPKRADHLNT